MSPLDLFDDRVGKLCRGRFAAKIRGPTLAFEQDRFDGVGNALRGLGLRDMPQQHGRREQHRRRIGDVTPLNIRRAAVDGFEQRVVVAEVGAGHNAEAANQTYRQIRDDITVQIFQQQDVEPRRVEHQLQTSVVDDQIAETDLLVLLRDVPGALEEQTVGQLHDVRLMNRHDFFPAVGARVVERELCDAGRRFLRDYFQAFHDPWHNFMLDAGIQTFGILAHDDQIDVLIARLDSWQIFDRPQIGVKIETLAQLHVDAGKTLAHWSRHRTLEGNAVFRK